MPTRVSTLWPLHVHPPPDPLPELSPTVCMRALGVPLRRCCVSVCLLTRPVQTQAQGIVTPGLQAGLGVLVQGSATDTSLGLPLSLPHMIIHKSPLLRPGWHFPSQACEDVGSELFFLSICTPPELLGSPFLDGRAFRRRPGWLGGRGLPIWGCSQCGAVRPWMAGMHRAHWPPHHRSHGTISALRREPCLVPWALEISR